MIMDVARIRIGGLTWKRAEVRLEEERVMR